jgi:formylglycine-generating enzyme required for sulfatase activity
VIVITITNKDGTTTIIETPDTSTVEVTTGEPSRSGLVTRDSRPTWYGWPADAPPAAIVPFDAAQAQRHQEAWAEHLGLPVAYTNNCGMKFVLIPPGEFLRGSTQAEIEEALNSVPDHARWREYVRSESPPHRVIVTQPVYLGVHEVTQALYQMVMGQNPSSFSATGTDQKLVEEVAGLDTTNHPVETVSWNEAVEFCTKLSQQEQLKAFYRRANETVTPLAGTGYRLSTEAEWEFACRAGTTTKYWSGDKDDDLLRAGWCGAKADRRTHPVGELPANPFGLFDVHGNVFEWVQDGWEPAFYDRFQQTPAVDPTGSMSSTWRLLRGGQWGEPLSDCRSSNRYAHVPYHRDCYTGFRVLLSADGVRESLKRID